MNLQKKLWLSALCIAPIFAQSTPAANAAEGGSVSHLPPAPEAVETPKKPTVTSAIVIDSPVPYYIDRGVTMAPLRPLCDFLGIRISVVDKVISLTQQRGEDVSKTRLMTMRVGGHSAQLTENGATRAVALSLPAETRLGNTFLPVKFMKDAFSVMIGFRARDNALVIRDKTQTGVLSPPTTPEYKGGNAATVTITNRVGRALSLRLSGPQSIVLELGKDQRVTRRVKPGVYSYKAGSAGMTARAGKRRLAGGRRSTWSWGRK